MSESHADDGLEFELPDALELEIAGLEDLPPTEQAQAFDRLAETHPRHASQIRFLQRMSASVEPEVDSHIGPYRIVRTLGEGGMGTVYLAQQEEPVSRVVALKVIKLGMDTNAILARFEHERQVLAAMNHDAIARIYDGGTTSRGQPFFAMEFVDGKPLHECCDHHKLTIKQRLELFRKVCAGVGHAHQRGVIHRDLKPGNILVAMTEDGPAPKIIDFGLARAVEQNHDQSYLTQAGQFVGTPDYMSPEQVSGGTVDTRTDVYALGVVLYELLVGVRPISSKGRKSSASLSNIQRAICELDPPSPSSRLSTIGERLQSHIERCSTTERELRRQVRGELDWIVMRALEKDPERRYRSAGALSDDIRRHLDNEPVLAQPPSAGYRLRKYIRRNRTVVVAAALIFVLLVTATAVSVQFAMGEASQRETAEKNLERFDLLAFEGKLLSARAAQDTFDPAWPEQAADIEAWLTKTAAELEDALPQLKQTLAKLQQAALPRSEADRTADRLAHPQWPRLVEGRKLLEELRYADDVRHGRRESTIVPLVANDLKMSTSHLIDAGRQRVGPNRVILGERRKALALLLRARELGTRDRAQKILLHMQLAWAYFGNGLDDEARTEMANASEGLAERHRRGLKQYQEKLEREIAAARGEFMKELIADYTKAVAVLEEQVDQQKTFRFTTTRNETLYLTLERTIEGIESLVREEVPRNRRRLADAKRLAESKVEHADTWRRIAAVTSENYKYRGSLMDARFPLAPQTGLVPIGRNPKTDLWEFYHLRTAKDPEVIPQHNEDGSLDLDADSGLVFVLMPPVLEQMFGELDANANATSGWQPRIEEKVGIGNLDPFFLSKYEMTRGQWLRLTGDEQPSRADWQGDTMDPSAMLRHPVQQVSWDECMKLLRRFRLDLPTEAQWEYACRAGNNWRWHTGSDPASLAGYANLDNAALGPSTEPFDAFVHTAPVGQFQPNRVGLHDMHGNVAEWCRDTFLEKVVFLAAGHGLRHAGTGAKVFRGGSFESMPYDARCARRMSHSPTVRMPSIGVRPVRAVQLAPAAPK